MSFYTQNGWAGSKYISDRSTKEIAQIMRAYVKGKYSAYKFSITSDYNDIKIALVEAPHDIWVTGYEERKEHTSFYNNDERFNRETVELLNDVQSTLLAYRMDDSDSMIDYFHTNFYYTIEIGKWDKPFAVVERKAKPKVEHAEVKSQSNLDVEVVKDIDTRDNSDIWVARVKDSLSKDDFTELKEKIKVEGGYYSRYKHGFIFKEKPHFESTTDQSCADDVSDAVNGTEMGEETEHIETHMECETTVIEPVEPTNDSLVIVSEAEQETEILLAPEVEHCTDEINHFKDISEFYPTPTKLIYKMLSGIDWLLVETILEPSAGKGDLCDEIEQKVKYSTSRRYHEINTMYADIETVEKNENLRHVLKGKGYKVIHDDFLTLNTYKRYDLIVMNPPFSNGDKHLLKALEMQKYGGDIVCLLNAETLKNTYSNDRKALSRKLEEVNAQIEYVEDAFLGAERKTGAEVAVIKVSIPKTTKKSKIMDELKQEEAYSSVGYENPQWLAESDYIKVIVKQYNFEVKAGVCLIDEFNSMSPLLLNDFESNDKRAGEILDLTVHGREKGRTQDAYIKAVRAKYWKTLFKSDEFAKILTSKMQEEWYSRIKELESYDFSLFNIYSIRVEMGQKTNKSIEDTVIELFDELSHKHSWFNETSKNIHYYNGWKTNKAYIINKKVIIPLNAFSGWIGYDPTNYSVEKRLQDIEKVFNFLDGGKSDWVAIRNVLAKARQEKCTGWVKCKYFELTFYKKGTCHIRFTDMDLLKKFNLFGSQRMGWLPPVYGKADYKDLNKEEKEVVNQFEGEKSYNETLRNKEYFITKSTGLLKLEE